MGLLEYQAMPSLRDVAHDGWLCTFTKEQQLEMPSARSWAAPVGTTGTVRKRQAVRPVHRVQNHTGRVLASSLPGGPPCWVSTLAFGIIGHAASPLSVSAMSRKNLSPSFGGSFFTISLF
jgi:hypothetical protein